MRAGNTSLSRTFSDKQDTSLLLWQTGKGKWEIRDRNFWDKQVNEKGNFRLLRKYTKVVLGKVVI